MSEDFGDGWYDGFVKAQEMFNDGVELDEISTDSILEMSERAEDEHIKSNGN